MTLPTKTGAASTPPQTPALPTLASLRATYGDLKDTALIKAMCREAFVGRVGVISSFGAESAVLLHMVSQVDAAVPVLFLNTGKLFGETLRYRDKLQEQLGLRDVRTLAPKAEDITAQDPDGILWSSNRDQCCHIRKVLPLDHALKDFDATFTGRKRFQTSQRENMHGIERERTPDGLPGLFRINPLASWGLDDLKAYILEHNLPRHPLVKDGYLSIGCMPCTDKVGSMEEYRDGRWAGSAKEECGIHKPVFEDGDGI